MSFELKPEWRKAIAEMREADCAVTVFNPEELAGADPYGCADEMCERGWNYIYEHGDPDNEEEGECNT